MSLDIERGLSWVTPLCAESCEPSRLRWWDSRSRERSNLVDCGDRSWSELRLHDEEASCRGGGAEGSCSGPCGMVDEVWWVDPCGDDGEAPRSGGSSHQEDSVDADCWTRSATGMRSDMAADEDWDDSDSFLLESRDSCDSSRAHILDEWSLRRVCEEALKDDCPDTWAAVIENMWGDCRVCGHNGSQTCWRGWCRSCWLRWWDSGSDERSNPIGGGQGTWSEVWFDDGAASCIDGGAEGSCRPRGDVDEASGSRCGGEDSWMEPCGDDGEAPCSDRSSDEEEIDDADCWTRSANGMRSDREADDIWDDSDSFRLESRDSCDSSRAYIFDEWSLRRVCEEALGVDCPDTWAVGIETIREEPWQRFTDPATHAPWLHCSRTGEWFFESACADSGWSRHIHHSLLGSGVWWWHQATARWFADVGAQ